MNSEYFQRWLDTTAARLATDDRVVGAVAFGSTAVVGRRDEWSDHDIAVVTKPGHEDAFRGNADWMADSDKVVAVVTEHHGGGRALYADGHLVDWGATSLENLHHWHATDYEVLFDKGGVAEAMEVIAVKPYPENIGQVDRDLGLFFMTILHGCGRLRRGENLSANALIRGAAVQHLVRATRTLREDNDRHGDRLDRLRRVEQDLPDLSARIVEALSQDLETAARALVDIAQSLRDDAGEQFPEASLDAVRSRLGWE